RVEQSAVLEQAVALGGEQPPTLLPTLEILNLAHHGRIAGHTVVIGKGDNIEALGLCLSQNVQIGGVGVLEIPRTRRVQVQINPTPLHPVALRVSPSRS